VGARGDGAGDLGEMGIHRGSVGEGHDEARCHTSRRADGAEDVGPLVASVSRRPWSGSPLRPDPGECSLLANACFILEPHFEWLVSCRLGQSGGYRFGEAFLKTS
jgi:hypothetical protein